MKTLLQIPINANLKNTFPMKSLLPIKIRVPVCLLMLIFTLTVLNGNAQTCFTPVTFAPAINTTINSTGYEPAVADFNGDGIMDVAVPTFNSPYIWVYLGKGDGTFGTGASFPVGNPANFDVYQAISADFNGDGKADLVVTDIEASTISVLFGNGDGTFQPQVIYSAGNEPYDIITADFNGDGHPDLAASGFQGKISIFLNDGSGNFTLKSPSPTGGFGDYGITTADFDGDGKLDLAVAYQSGNVVYFFHGNGDGTFGTKSTITGTFNGPYSIKTADFNKDGFADLAVVNNAFGASVSKLSILLGNGTGGFSTPTNYTIGNYSQGLTFGDFNNDGNIDIATSSGSASVVFLGNGTGGFTSAVNIAVGGYTIVTADFNGDGQPDLLTPNVSVLLLTSLATAKATSPVCTGGSNTTLNLTGSPSSMGSYAWSGPNSFTSSSQNPTITSPTTLVAGVYHLTITDSHGCTSSTKTKSVVVNSPITFSQTVTACGSISVGKTVHSSSGTYTDVITSNGGCDSTVTTYLTIKPFSAHTQTVSLCTGQSITVGSHTYTQAGTYQDIFTAQNGCDSILTTNVKIYFGTGPTSFGTVNNFGVSGNLYLQASGDFNGDGKPDLAITTNSGNSVYILLNNGSGSFGGSVAYTTGATPRGVVTGDFNGDGKIDVAVANQGANTVSILLGNGDGTFQTNIDYPVHSGGGDYFLIAGDFNQDGKIDLATANETTNDVSILLGNGNGTFSTAANYASAGTGVTSISSADFNGDGYPDIAIVNQTTNNISILLNNGNGTYAAATSLSAMLSMPYQIATADFNGDGKIDLAVDNYTTNTVTVLQGNGSGGFTAFAGSPFSTGSGSNPNYLVSADFNGDGNIDLATSNYGASTVGILLGDGTGNFGAPVTYSVNNPWSIISDDFNGDGRPDLALADNDGSGNESVLLNTQPTFATVSATTPVCTSGLNSALGLVAGTSGLVNYSWSGPNSYTSSLQSPFIINPSTAAAGVYTLKVTDSHGCTATGNTVSVVVNSSKTTSQTISACGFYYVGSHLYTTSGTKTDVLSTSKGCDSTVTTNLTINPLSPATNQNINICLGQTYTIGSNSYSQSGIYESVSAGTPCPTVSTTNLGVLFGAGGAPSFGAAQNTSVGAPYFSAAADFNGDGKLDFAVANNSVGNTINVYPGNGNGTFGVTSSVTVGILPEALVSADFNGDGKPDLAVANYNSGTISVLINNSSGASISFLSQVTYAVGNNPSDVKIGDFNSDGKIDLAVVNYGSNSVSILLGKGDGTFQNANNITVGSGPHSVAVGDFNLDGVIDLLVGEYTATDVRFLAGNGDGTFSGAVTSSTGSAPWYISCADFNKDGKLDLAFGSDGTAASLYVCKGNGDGTFQASVSYSLGTTGIVKGSYSITAADFNGDGIIDLASANAATSNEVSVFLGSGSGTFNGPTIYTTGSRAYGILSGDFNGDGLLDLLVNNNLGGSFSVLLNTTSKLPPAATASSNTPVCPEGPLNLTGGGSVGTGTIVSYAWSGPNSYSSTTQSPSSITPTVAGAGTYTITVTDSRGCTASNTTNVMLKPSPAIAVSPISAVCTGTSSAVLTASGGTSYTWAPVTALTPTTANSATETAQISLLTFYTVTGVGSNGCTNNTVVPVATVATGGVISPNYSIICSEGTQALTVVGAAGNDYQWQMSTDNTTWTNISGQTNTTYTTTSGNSNTNKFYRLLANSNACWNVASTTAEVDVSNPVINVTATNITDNTLTLNWSPIGTGNYSINYSGASSGLQTSLTPPKTLTGLSANSTYNITVTQTGVSGCSASGTLTQTTLCAVPTNLTATSPAPTQIRVNWNGPTGNYRVYYRPLYAYVTYFTKDVTNATSVLLTKQGNNNIYASTTYQVFVSRLDCPSTGNIGQPTSPVYVTVLPTPVNCATPKIDTVFSTCPVLLEVQLHGSPTGNYNVYIQRLTPTLQAVNSYGISSGDFVINASAGQQYLISADSKCSDGTVSTLNLWHSNVTIKPICGVPTNLVLSNPTCHGFTASWNADPCISNTVSGYALSMRQAGQINFNSYGVALPSAGIGPHELVNILGGGKNMQVFVRSVYTCGSSVTYGPSSQIATITTLSSGCRDEEEKQPEETKTVVQQYSPDNQEVFSLYPNPNAGEFTVNLSRLNTNEDEVRIEVFNVIGQTVITQITSIADGHMSEFVNLPNGTAAGNYIVRLTAGKNVYTAKVNISK